MISIGHPLALHNRLLLLNRNPSFKIRSSSTVRERELGSELYASAPFPQIKAAKRVILVRHGQSTWNEEGRIQGSSDFSVLTKKGEAQADTSRQMLIDDAFDVCFSRFTFAAAQNIFRYHFLLKPAIEPKVI
jgi:hypothetical protein